MYHNNTLIEKFAQATLDSMGPPEQPEDLPSAMKWHKTREDSEIETGDSRETQMSGVVVNQLPAKNKLNDRLKKLIEFFHAIGQ